jgi:outer membrane lipoprotein LolB
MVDERKQERRRSRTLAHHSSLITHHRARLAALCLLALTYGCATPPHPTTARSPSELHNWQASGRIAVSGANNGGSGSFNWDQRGTAADVRLRGPVGVGSLHLKLSDDALTIETGKGERFDAEQAEIELAERLGAQVPARDLRYWLVGMPAPGENEWVGEGDSATLIQHQWRIEYRFASTSGVKLPTRLIATSGPAKVRIVVDKWTIE